MVFTILPIFSLEILVKTIEKLYKKYFSNQDLWLVIRLIRIDLSMKLPSIVLYFYNYLLVNKILSIGINVKNSIMKMGTQVNFGTILINSRKIFI